MNYIILIRNTTCNLYMFTPPYHLEWNSPCRDTGTGLAPGLPDRDYEGDPRSALGAVDMGADEYNYHLYHTGAVVPGDAMQIKVVGYPTASVTLYLGSGIQDPPMNTRYGDFWLTWPPLWYGPIGTISNSGVLTMQTIVPLAWTAGEEYPLQALVGPSGGPWTLFTNLMVLVVVE